ncbi:hypothetical protein CEXT_271401 [Caerostris extrusa]|uniref:Uncharacterized protein n=1 Tax=Caerostris extrusa TaxID=172846 RepID=A0AAV4U204_CAEEX|nr:hypothetical protein CEXT_271401 [Caerostris extrusa]
MMSLFSIRQTGCRKPQCGRASSTTTEINTARVEEMIHIFTLDLHIIKSSTMSKSTINAKQENYQCETCAGVGGSDSSHFRTIEMARRSENWSRLEVRAVIRFLLAKEYVRI